MKHPLNQILYGPPGTGKTWSTVHRTLAIIEGKSVKEVENEIESENSKSVKQRFNEMKDCGQIEMVTFHQSFSYEDFIEGIRPVLGDSGNDSSNVQYEIVDGVFKRIADRACENLRRSNRDHAEIDLDALLEAYADDVEARLQEGEEIKLRSSDNKIDYRIGAVNRKNELFKSITVRGAQSTWITRLARRIIERDYQKFCNKEIKSHSDIRPSWSKRLKAHPQSRSHFALFGEIKKFQDRWNPEEQPIRQAVDERMNYVLIIDEINRGNIAKIFGELITLIEDTKRIGGTDATTVTLPYSSNSDDDDRFGVPKNLYIIGTMNTADRSIALLDTALRRRFDFIEMMPQANFALIAKDIKGVNCQELLRVMNERIVVLFDREHQIGHSYFIGVDSMETLSHAFRNRIIPLLQEYFYDDWGKIDAVLNNNKFVTKTEINSDFSNNPDLVDSGRTIYELIKADDSEWKNPERYQAIYEPTTPAAENNGE